VLSFDGLHVCTFYVRVYLLGLAYWDLGRKHTMHAILLGDEVKRVAGVHHDDSLHTHPRRILVPHDCDIPPQSPLSCCWSEFQNNIALSNYDDIYWFRENITEGGCALIFVFHVCTYVSFCVILCTFEFLRTCVFVFLFVFLALSLVQHNGVACVPFTMLPCKSIVTSCDNHSASESDPLDFTSSC
jgi:hypothetical protein